MPVKYVFFFRYGEQGWSESFYRNAFFDAAGQVVLDNYIQRRLNLLSTACSLISVRASDVNSARDVTIKDIPLAGMPGTWVYGSADPTAPNQTAQAILLRLTDGAQHYRSFNMLGLPDHIISDNVVPPPEEIILRGRLNTWIGAVNAASFTMKVNSVPTLAGRILAYGVQDDINQLVKIETVAPLPAPGVLIRIKSSKPVKELNRLWRVAASAGTEIKLAKSAWLNAFGPVEGGIWEVPAYVYPPILQYTLSRVSVRKTGIPFGVQRGRRSSMHR